MCVYDAEIPAQSASRGENSLSPAACAESRSEKRGCRVCIGCLCWRRERERQFVRGAREAALRLTSFVFVWTCAVAVEWLWSAKGARRGRERGVVIVDGGSRGARACKLSSTRGAKIKLRGGWNFKGPSVYCEGMWWWLQGGVLFGALRWYFTLYENILLSEPQVSTAEKNLRFRN